MVGIALVIGLVLIFIGTYALNKSTPPPELDETIDKEACNACKNFACAYKEK
ncbi:MAG: hypothetical protein K9L74_01765 [Candidatus Izimaplasma sp.]|nr:hypothetical protein [Candidatus Izimaplasma bacterium]